MYSNEGGGGEGLSIKRGEMPPPIDLLLFSIIDGIVSLLYILQEYELFLFCTSIVYISVGWNKAKGISGELHAAVVLPGG